MSRAATRVNDGRFDDPSRPQTLPTESWYEVIGDRMLADVIPERILPPSPDARK
jgi:hypothetical protein